VRRWRTLSILGPLLRLLGRVDPREAAAYEMAAREAFKAGTPTDVNSPPLSADSGDITGSRDARPPGTLAEPARLQEATTAKRPKPLRSEPTNGSDRVADTNATEPEIEDRSPDLTPEAGDAATDLLRTPRSVTPVADDFFDGLIRRVEGKR
jgi:hypothetical protein